MTERLIRERVKTERFRMSQGELIKRMLPSVSPVLWIVLGVLFIMCIIAGITVNVRFIAVGMMLLFIVAPALAAYIYFSFGLKKYVAFNVLPHTLRFAPEGVAITIFTPSADTEGNGDNDNDMEEEEVAEEGKREMFIERSRLGKADITVSAIFIPVGNKQEGFIYIPLEMLS